jgi:hypothetical protein
MKPIFTIHAGEYLVGDYLEKKFADCEIWVPSKDSGTDILITNSKDRSKNVGIQVKFSKDFLPEMEAAFHDNLSACGWWTLNPEKIKNSNAEIWILAPYSFVEKRVQFIIIEPKKLLERLGLIHGIVKNVNVYLWVTKSGHCFEARGIKKNIQYEIKNGVYSNIAIERDFSMYLNDWNIIDEKLH